MSARLGLGVMAGFLLLAAVVQINDPDPIIWMSVYGFPGLLTLSACVNMSTLDTSYWRIICIIALSGILLFTGITTSAYIDNGKLSQNLLTTEEGRESLGLLIVISWLLMLLFSGSRMKERAPWWHTVYLAFALVPIASWISYKYYFQGSVDLPEHCEGIV